MEHKTDLDALDAMHAMQEMRRCELTWEERARAEEWPRTILDAYPAIAAELREARRTTEKAEGWRKRAEEFENLVSLLREQLQGQKARVEELEAEIEVRDNSATAVFDTLKAALPNRGFHSEMEAAEAIKKAMDALKVQLAVYDVALSQIYWKSVPMGDDRGNSDIAEIAGDALKGDTSRLDARDRRMKALGTAEELREITAPYGGDATGCNPQILLDALIKRAAELETAGEGEGNGQK